MFAAVLMLDERTPPHSIANEAELTTALTPYTKADAYGSWQDNKALLINALHHNTKSSSNETAPYICPRSGRIIASWVRLDNRTELCEQFGLREDDQLSDPQIILKAYELFQHDCVPKLEGDFSFLIYDPATQEAFCARDAIGVKPLFFTQAETHLAVATSIAAIMAIKGAALSPDLNWIALFASGFSLAETNTAYQSVQRLAPGHFLKVRFGTVEKIHRYHGFSLDAPHETKRDPVWVERYRSLFEQAVDARNRSRAIVGAESSGGLDSASIVARLAEIRSHDRDRIPTYSLVAHQRELDLLEELTKSLSIPPSHQDIRPEMLRIDSSVERAITAIGHPPEHGQPLLSAGFFEHAQGFGVRTMLSGFGGDELVTGYAKHLVDELQIRGEWRAVFRELEGSLPRRMLRFARRMVKGPHDPLIGPKAQLAIKLNAAFVSREFLHDSGLQRKIERWMVPDFGNLTLNRYAVLSPGFRYGMTGRLEASALFAASYGIEYRFPLLDRRLIQQFLRTPSIEKRHGSLGRYLHRRAVADLIPHNIAWQATKDMGPPLEGHFAFAKAAHSAWDDLPSLLQEIFDRGKFAQAQDLVAASPNETETSVMRARFLLWQVDQLCLWLSNR